MEKIMQWIDKVSDRHSEEHNEFLIWYEKLVRSASPAATKAFGNMDDVELTSNESAGIELTASDFLWWKERISNGARFKHGVSSVKANMLNRLCSAAEQMDMTAEEKGQLIDAMQSHKS